MGGHNMLCCPTFFILGFAFEEVSKNNSDVSHVFCEVFVMLDVRDSKFDIETEFGMVLLIVLFFISFYLCIFRKVMVHITRVIE